MKCAVYDILISRLLDFYRSTMRSIGDAVLSSRTGRAGGWAETQNEPLVLGRTPFSE
jgi:hypothetical protein